jgi:putative hydrolase of the HAD superfamily
MVRAILFAMGGTLDGDGHWLDRFVRLYAAHGFTFTRDAIRRSFDHAERCAAADPSIMSADLETLVRRHVSWQFEAHGLHDLRTRESIVTGFVTPARAAAQRNRVVLDDLRRQDLVLGVVSNACGNAQALCDDLGFAPLLSVVVDSRVAGVAKPDPAIYRLALQAIHVEPSEAMMVGDSYERDILPAHAIGMKTAWRVHGQAPRDPGLAHVCIGDLAELTRHVGSGERVPT